MSSSTRVRKYLLSICLTLSCTAPANAQTKAWADVNFGVAQSNAKEATFTFTEPLFLETAALAAVYPKPSTGSSFDFGAGYMFAPKFGIGFSVAGSSHQDSVSLGISVPHPFFFNDSAIDGSTTAGKLQRTEGAVHVQMMVVPYQTSRVRFRVFGGPSFFRYKANMVQDIEFSQVAPAFSSLNLVSITGFQSVDAKGSGWGFHVGGDASWFFSKVVGVGGVARYSRGKVTLDREPLSEVAQDITVGGFQAGGGLRLRF